MEDRSRKFSRARERERKILQPASFVETSNIQSSSFSFSPSLPSLRIHPPFTHFCLRRGKILQQRQIPGAFAVAIPAGPKTGVGAGRLIELEEETKSDGVGRARVARSHVFNHFARSQWHGTGRWIVCRGV